MRKASPTGSERSKVRILFVDADLAPGDIQELTQALTTAIRPTSVIVRNGAPQRLATSPTSSDGHGSSEAEVEVVDAELADESVTDAPVPKSGPSRKRTYRKPMPVEMDMKASGKPFEDFAKDKAPSAHRGRYLVAAAWLHDFAKLETISSDHVFTCYKVAGWTFDVADPTMTFRQLKAEGLGSAKGGNFAINHLGLAEVEKMKSAA